MQSGSDWEGPPTLHIVVLTMVLTATALPVATLLEKNEDVYAILEHVHWLRLSDRVVLGKWAKR